MKTVYAYVVADLLHYGHVKHLERAKALGGHLTVGILTDKACMEKKAKPVMSFAERAKVVKALGCVDIIVWQENYSPLENVKRYKPDILAEGMNHRGFDYIYGLRAYCIKENIKIIPLPYTEGISSTKIKERIINAHKKNKLL